MARGTTERVRMASKRDLENRLAQLRGDGSGDGVELTVAVRDEVIETPWEPADGEAPAAGTTVTRYYRTEAGEWVVDREDGGGES